MMESYRGAKDGGNHGNGFSNGHYVAKASGKSPRSRVRDTWTKRVTGKKSILTQESQTTGNDSNFVHPNTMGDRQALQTSVTRMLQHSILQLCNEHVGYSHKLQILGVLCMTIDDEQQELVVKVNNTLKRVSPNNPKNVAFESGLTTQALPSHSISVPTTSDQQSIPLAHNEQNGSGAMNGTSKKSNGRKGAKPVKVAQNYDEPTTLGCSDEEDAVTVIPTAPEDDVTDGVNRSFGLSKDEPQDLTTTNNNNNNGHHNSTLLRQRLLAGTVNESPAEKLSGAARRKGGACRNTTSQNHASSNYDFDSSLGFNTPEDLEPGEKPSSRPLVDIDDLEGVKNEPRDSYHQSYYPQVDGAVDSSAASLAYAAAYAASLNAAASGFPPSQVYQMYGLGGAYASTAARSVKDLYESDLSPQKTSKNDATAGAEADFLVDSMATVSAGENEPTRKRRRRAPEDQLTPEEIAEYLGQTEKNISSFKCKYCSEEFDGLTRYIQHTLSQHAAYICHQCGKSFTTKSSLLRHRPIHTGMRRFACGICKKTFYRKDKCKAHIKRHLGADQNPDRYTVTESPFTAGNEKYTSQPTDNISSPLSMVTSPPEMTSPATSPLDASLLASSSGTYDHEASNQSALNDTAPTFTPVPVGE